MQVISRKVISNIVGVSIPEEKIQFSINSDGRICIRLYKPNQKTKTSKEMVINLTHNETKDLVEFIKSIEDIPEQKEMVF